MRKQAVVGVVASLLFSLLLPTSAEALRPPDRLRVQARVSAKQIEVGTKFYLAGTINHPLAGVWVRREVRLDGVWVRPAKAATRTDANGDWRMKLAAPDTPTTLRFRISTPLSTKSRVVYRTVKVLPRLNPVLLAPVAPVVFGSAGTIAGNIENLRGEYALALERRDGDAWISQQQITASTTDFAFTLSPAESAGVYSYRVTATDALGQASSDAVDVVVLPQPTIALNSIEEVETGLSVQLSGNSSGLAEDRSVQLEWSNGFDWTPLSAPIEWSGDQFTLTFAALAPGLYSLRATASSAYGLAVSNIVELQVRESSTPPAVDALGPGNPPMIWGMDISRWNHMDGDTNKDGKVDLGDDGAPIDFNAAYAGGMRFVFIKASDGGVHPTTGATVGDNWAHKFAGADRAAAQAAGLYTGFYHYAGMPETSNLKSLTKDARADAILAASRIAEVGGYNSRDLPYVLDLETDDLSGSGVASVATAEGVELWAKTWLSEMFQRTGRRPILYTSFSILADLSIGDPFWADYKIWVAAPNCRLAPGGVSSPCTEDLINQGARPGWTSSGLVDNPWSQNGALNWTFWQYRYSTSLGKKLGVQNGSALDLNVFNGSATEFLALTEPTWTPSEGDYQPTASEVTLTASTELGEAGMPIAVDVTAVRTSNSAPAVSGDVIVRVAGKKLSGVTVTPTGIGTWKAEFPPLAAGESLANIEFRFSDTSGGYAATTLSDYVLNGPVAES